MAVLKIARFWQSAKSPIAATVVPLEDSMGLDAFGSEAAAMPAPQRASPSSGLTTVTRTRTSARRSRTRALAIVGGVVAAAVLGVGLFVLRGHSLPWPARTGSVTFDTVPGGIDVFLGGKTIGRSPVTVALAAGTYDVRLGDGAQARRLQVAVTAGTSVVQHYEMPPNPVPAAPTTGQLRIQTDPSNLPVLVDGVERGTSPLTIDQVSAGDHDVAVRTVQTVIKRAVHVAAGEKTSVIISSTPSKPDAAVVTAGWLSVTASIPLKVKEGGRLVGSTDVDKLMLSSGDHDLEFTNDALGFHLTRRVNITPGKTTASSISVPNGSLSLNALPWADVFVDGNHVGQTPLGNIALPIGTHEVIFRHPDLGERKETVTVTAGAPTRLGVDLRKK